MMKRIFVIGESPLVEEYASLCSENGFAVSARPNAHSKVKLPRDVKRIAKPSKSIGLALELTNLDLDVKKRNLIELDETLPPRIPVITSSTTVMLAQQAIWVKHPERIVGIGALPTLLQGKLVEFASLDLTHEQAKGMAREFASSLGRESAFVVDTPGLVMPRVLCMIINEACFAMMEGVADARDLDKAMRLGTNYPSGPFEWAERIGWQHVLAVLDSLHDFFGEDRYRAAPFLRRVALHHHRSTV